MNLQSTQPSIDLAEQAEQELLQEQLDQEREPQDQPAPEQEEPQPQVVPAAETEELDPEPDLDLPKPKRGTGTHQILVTRKRVDSLRGVEGISSSNRHRIYQLLSKWEKDIIMAFSLYRDNFVFSTEEAGGAYMIGIELEGLSRYAGHIYKDKSASKAWYPDAIDRLIDIGALLIQGPTIGVSEQLTNAIEGENKTKCSNAR